MLTVSRIHDAWSLSDLFDDGQWCPVCHKSAFTLVEGHGIECDHCGAEFRVRATAGDPGVVIDCWANARGKYAAIVPGSFGLPYGFWQVIKECEAGLEDRERWCTNTSLYMTDYHKEDPLIFAEIFSFVPYRAAKCLAQEKWHKTATGKKLDAEYAAAKTALDYHAWDEVGRRWQSSLWEYERTHYEAEQARLVGLVEGWYFADQCEHVFWDDGMCAHSCIPKAGEKPRVKMPLYEKK